MEKTSPSVSRTSASRMPAASPSQSCIFQARSAVQLRTGLTVHRLPKCLDRKPTLAWQGGNDSASSESWPQGRNLAVDERELYASEIAPELLTTRQTDELLNTGERTVCRWSRSEIAPARIRINGTIRYRRSEYLDWIVAGCPRVNGNPSHIWTCGGKRVSRRKLRRHVFIFE